MRTSFTIASVTIIVLAYFKSSTSQTSCCTSLNLNLSWVRIFPPLVISFEKSYQRKHSSRSLWCHGEPGSTVTGLTWLSKCIQSRHTWLFIYLRVVESMPYLRCELGWKYFVLAARHGRLRIKEFLQTGKYSNFSDAKCQMCKACLMSKTFYWNLQYRLSRWDMLPDHLYLDV